MENFKMLLYHRLWNLLCQNEQKPSPPPEIACGVPPVKVPQARGDLLHFCGRLKNKEDVENGNYILTTEDGGTYNLSISELTLGFKQWTRDTKACYHVFAVEEYRDEDDEDDEGDDAVVYFGTFICDEVFYRIAEPYPAISEKEKVLTEFFYCRPAKEWSRFRYPTETRKSIFTPDEWELTKAFLGSDVFAKNLLNFVSYYSTVVYNIRYARVDTALWNYQSGSVCDDHIQTFLSLVPRLGLYYEDVQYTFDADGTDPEELTWQRLLMTYSIMNKNSEWGETYTLTDAICEDVITGLEPALICSRADIRKLAISLANKAKHSEKAREALFLIFRLRESDFTAQQSRKICEGLFARTDNPVFWAKAIQEFPADSYIWKYIYERYGIQMIGYGKT